MIIEFINAFKNAYRTIYENKLKAKNCISHAKKKKNEYKNVSKLSLNVRHDLSDLYCYFPKEKRKDCVINTLDLLGLNDVYSMIGFYLSLQRKIDASIKLMKKSYKERNYDKVVSIYKDLFDSIENEFKDFEQINK